MRFKPATSTAVTATLIAVGQKRAATAADALAGTGEELGQSSGQLFWAAGSPGTIWSANLDGTNTQPIVLRQAEPQGVAANATNVYWASAEQGIIFEANPDGTNAQAIVHGQTDAAGVAVGASHIYWADTSPGTIWEANLDGTGAQSVVKGQNNPTGWR